MRGVLSPPSVDLAEPAGHLAGRRLILFALAVFVVAFAYGTLRIGREFIGDREGTACGLVMMPPINFLRHGPFEQRLGGIINAGQVEPANYRSYVHHPPAVTIASWLAHAAFGRADWVARLLPTLFAALTATLLAVALASGTGGSVGAGVLAAGVFVLSPINAMYGGMPDYVNFQVAFFTALTLWLWLRSLDAPRPWAMRSVALGAFAFACLSDWPGFYAAPVIWIGTWLVRRRLDRFWHVAFPAIAVVLLVGLAAWMSWAGGDTSLLNRVLYRSAGAPDHGPTHVGFVGWLAGVLSMTATLHTWPVLIAAVVAVITIAVNAWRRPAGASSPERFVLVLAGMWSTHFVVARQGCFEHEWWHMMFTPALAAGAGVALSCLVGWVERRGTPRLAGWGVAVVLLAVLGWRAWTLDASRRAQYADAGGYTLRELGLSIRRAAAPTEGVLTSDCSDWDSHYVQSALGWYADRQMRPCIIDVPGLMASLDAGPYPLFYGYVQPGGPKPRWFVMPDAHRAPWPELAAWLDAHYPETTDGKFHVYDLARTK